MIISVFFAQKNKIRKSCGCGREGKNNYIWKGCGDLSGEKWGQICRGAKSRNIPVKITIEEAWEQYEKQKGKCALTGWNLILYKVSKTTSAATDASLDRIDSSKPYEPNNTQWVHKWVNQAKNNLEQEEFINMCKAIANNFSIYR